MNANKDIAAQVAEHSRLIAGMKEMILLNCALTADLMLAVGKNATHIDRARKLKAMAQKFDPSIR